MGCDGLDQLDRKSTRLNSSHLVISYAVFCLKKNNDDDRVAPARLAQLLEFGQGLGHGRGSGTAAIELDDVAEVAVEGAAARIFFFFNDTATTEIYTLSLHDALPI